MSTEVETVEHAVEFCGMCSFMGSGSYLGKMVSTLCGKTVIWSAEGSRCPDCSSMFGVESTGFCGGCGRAKEEDEA